MSAKVSLQELVDAFESVSDGLRFFVNTKSGEIGTVSQEDEYSVDRDDPADDRPDWQVDAEAQVREILESDDWLELPDRFDAASSNGSHGLARAARAFE